jgi:hypothetical protein
MKNTINISKKSTSKYIPMLTEAKVGKKKKNNGRTATKLDMKNINNQVTENIEKLSMANERNQGQ